MTVVTVKREMNLPSFGAWKWKAADFERPLTLRLKQANARIFLKESAYISKGVVLFPDGLIELIFDPAPTALTDGLATKGLAATAAAQLIYDAYVEAHQKFEALLCSAGKVKSLMRTSAETFGSFFSANALSRHAVEYSIDGSAFRAFTPKVKYRRGHIPLYTAKQLVTPARWQDLQRAADEGAFPEGELLELHWIRAKVSWRDVRVAALEASIISETLLRAYALEVLKANGFSNSKVKRLKDELTFNNLLNIVLPLSLRKAELKAMQKAIEAVDRLRAIRNDLIHGNITEKDVDRTAVETGIEEAIRLVRFLQKKLTP